MSESGFDSESIEAEDALNFTFGPPIFSFTPQFGDRSEAEPVPEEDIAILLEAEDSGMSSEEEVPDEEVRVGRLSPPRGSQLYSRKWRIELVRLREKKTSEIESVMKTKAEQQSTILA